MTTVPMIHRPPASATMPSLFSSAIAPDTQNAPPPMRPGASVFTLPRLRIPTAAEGVPSGWPPSSHKDTGSLASASINTSVATPTHSFLRSREELPRPDIFTPTASGMLGFAPAAASIPPLQVMNRSPSAPADHSDREPKFGLAHLLEAAQHCHTLTPSVVQIPLTQRAQGGDASSAGPVDPMAVPNSRLHSINYLIHNPSDEDRPAKRPRPDLSLDVNASYPYQFHQSTYQASSYEASTPVYPNAPNAYPQITPTGAHEEPRGHADEQGDGKNVWETVLTTGNFPDDICLSENPSCCNKNSDSAGNPVKQGRWTNDEKEFAENLIQQVRNGEVMLPPNVSLRKFIADSLQCKAMRVSKKFRSLSSCQSPQNSSEERQFNPLSLQSIMNDDASGESLDEVEDERRSPMRESKTLKRSDYSQHGAVRSGRWSLEEENYAKAMIEAFKSGYLPLHGNVSLRKFLSEVLVCHPMRISKKFVGYVRKYHWYRIAAGKSDPEAKRQALEQLCQLEREFWASMQQNQEWATIQQENRR